MTDLLETYRGVVYPWQCDHVGHMNVMWYVGKFDEASWNLFAAVGVDGAFLKKNARGMAAVQQNITYKREMNPGDTVAVRSAFLEVREKLARFVHEMRDAVTGEVSAICVLTALHLDTQTRKSVPFPAEVVERARALVRAYQVPEANPRPS